MTTPSAEFWAKHAALEKRVADLERWRAFILGAGAASTIFLTAMAHSIVKALGLTP